MTAAAIGELARRLLADILMEPVEALAEVRTILDPAMLAWRPERAVYEAALALADRGEPVTVGAVWGELLSRGEDPLFKGGMADLDGLANSLAAPIAAETVQIARKLADFAREWRARMSA